MGIDWLHVFQAACGGAFGYLIAAVCVRVLFSQRQREYDEFLRGIEFERKRNDKAPVRDEEV